jgi:hypothetical protein
MMVTTTPVIPTPVTQVMEWTKVKRLAEVPDPFGNIKKS